MNLDQLLPQVQKLVSDKILKLLSDEGPKVAIKGVYTMLPGAIRLFIKEEAFVEFCLLHQEKLFGKAKTQRKKAPVKKSSTKKAKASVKDSKRK